MCSPFFFVVKNIKDWKKLWSKEYLSYYLVNKKWKFNKYLIQDWYKLKNRIKKENITKNIN